MSRGPWTQGARTRRTETRIREVLGLALEDARTCVDGHRDFRFPRGLNLRVPIEKGGEVLALDALVAWRHLELAIVRVCGKDQRTVETWGQVMEDLGYIRSVPQEYVVVSMAKMGTLDHFWSVQNPVNESIVQGYREDRLRER